MNHTLLVIEDDKQLRTYLKEFLLENGFLVHAVGEGIRAIELLKKIQPDLIILDLGLPDINGETVCAQIKKEYENIPVVMLTARDSAEDIVRGLNIGADDYITKPFDGEELLARIKARLRGLNVDNGQLKIGDLLINNQSYEVKRMDKTIYLTPQEFKLLSYLAINKGKVLTREMILSRIWGSSPDIETRVVDVYIGYLRKKVDSGFDKSLIHSIRGFGYMLKE